MRKKVQNIAPEPRWVYLMHHALAIPTTNPACIVTATRALREYARVSLPDLDAIDAIEEFLDDEEDALLRKLHRGESVWSS